MGEKKQGLMIKMMGDGENENDHGGDDENAFGDLEFSVDIFFTCS